MQAGAGHRDRRDFKMAGTPRSDLDQEFYEVKGGLDVLFSLREELEQWVEEAQDDSKHEALENVLGHIEVIEDRYRTRQEEIKKKRSGG